MISQFTPSALRLEIYISKAAIPSQTISFATQECLSKCFTLIEIAHLGLNSNKNWSIDEMSDESQTLD
ncbi:CLUMA_CG016103, isoform A [Clunio marinus]|uniref:CLUMA_CG016103, isoform A n=1 Tax=Clunio marinus TaxID=568069 RepID=A0A1J1IR48_9DIPT|nr:CLUMA_CG016103, isoform A [Clunio marinus]